MSLNKPDISPEAFLIGSCQILGDVKIAPRCNIWPGAVLRGDSGRLDIGEDTNIQDNSVVHSEGGITVSVGKGVTIGHLCIVHGCRIGENTLIGMGSIVMDEADIGKNCLIGAGSLVTGGTVIPDGSLAFGRPAKVVRQLTEQEIQKNRVSASHYVELAVRAAQAME